MNIRDALKDPKWVAQNGQTLAAALPTTWQTVGSGMVMHLGAVFNQLGLSVTPMTGYSIRMILIWMSQAKVAQFRLAPAGKLEVRRHFKVVVDLIRDPVPTEEAIQMGTNYLDKFHGTGAKLKRTFETPTQRDPQGGAPYGTNLFGPK